MTARRQRSVPNRTSRGRRRCPVLLLGLAVHGVFAVLASAEEPPRYVGRWGLQGSDPGLLEYPQGIGTDAAGVLYVADTRNHRIQKFSADGRFLAGWGEFGTGHGQFDTPTRLAVDPRGFVYVADAGNGRIQKFSLNGDFVAAWEQAGEAPGQFLAPYAVAVDPAGDVYVSDTTRGDVQKLSAEGAPLAAWGSAFNSDGRFHRALGLTATAAHVYVTEIGYQNEDCCECVYQFTTAGAFVRRWGRKGEASGEFITPLGVATDSVENVFVIDHHNFRLQKFTRDGDFLATWGRRGTAPGELIDPHDIVLDPSGDVFITDFGDDGQVMHWSYRPTPVQQPAWGAVKNLFRPARRRPRLRVRRSVLARRSRASGWQWRRRRARSALLPPEARFQCGKRAASIVVLLPPGLPL